MEMVDDFPNLLTAKEVGKMLRMGEGTIRRYAASKVIPAKRAGFVWRFDRKEIEKWMNGDVESSRGKDERGAALQTGTD